MTPPEKTDEAQPPTDELKEQLGPEIDEALLALDELALDDPEEALATFDTLPEPVQALIDFQLLLARAHHALGQLDAARDILLSLLPKHGENPDVHHQLGDVLEDLGNEAGANEHFERVRFFDLRAFENLPQSAQELARKDATHALKRLESVTSSRSLRTAIETLPSEGDVKSGADPRALSRFLKDDRSWTIYLANLAFEYGDIEDDEERLHAMVGGLVEGETESLAPSPAELVDLGLQES